MVRVWFELIGQTGGKKADKLPESSNAYAGKHCYFSLHPLRLREFCPILF